MLQNCTTWKVLSEFLIDPKKKHQIRQISRDINLATTSVKLQITKLIKENLIKEKKDIFKYYQANFNNPQFRFYKKIYTLTQIQELISYLEDETSANAIYLFGSCAKGEDTIDSDIDIFVNSKEKVLNLKKFETKIRRKIQLFFAKDINELPIELRNNILNGIKLSGYLRIWKQ